MAAKHTFGGGNGLSRILPPPGIAFMLRRANGRIRQRRDFLGVGGKMDEVRNPKIGMRVSAADRIGSAVARDSDGERERRRILISFGVAAAVLVLAIGITFFIWRDVGAPAPSASAQVQEIEKLLGELGFTPGPVDGVMDAATAEAIRSYQQAAGLPEDGNASPELLEELRAVAGPTQ